MKNFLNLILSLFLVVGLSGCVSGGSDEEILGDESVESADSDFEDTESDAEVTEEEPEVGAEIANEEAEVSEEEDVLADEEDLPVEDGAEPAEQAQEEAAPVEKLVDSKTEQADSAAPVEIVQDEPPKELEIADLPPPPVESQPVVIQEAQPVQENVFSQAISEITNIKFEASEAGGSIIIEGSSPLTYTTRPVVDKNQFIVEIENARLPSKLTRPFNTRDFSGNVGAVNAYQNPGSNTARVVVQLREGAGTPSVQVEGNSLLVLTGAAVAPTTTNLSEAGVGGAISTPQASVGEGQLNQELGVGGAVSEGSPDNALMSSTSLEEFLSGNVKFYGRKISIEASKIAIRDAIQLIAEESGANLIIDNEVAGEVSLKLREIPWDQALVTILKSNKLGYIRQGTIIRIAPLETIRTEEESAVKLAEAKSKSEPLKVVVIPVSYAGLSSLDTQVKPFLSERGKSVTDTRTSSILITDIEGNLNRIRKLISSLDVPPRQVLIEGKIVEARDTFSKAYGLQFGYAGQAMPMGQGTLTPRLNINAPSAGNLLQMDVAVQTASNLGNLSAKLGLLEQEDIVKVISSPRILTLQNEPAKINQSVEVPVPKRSGSADGGGEVGYEFKKIGVSLDVTPQITNDDSVILKVNVAREFPGGAVGADSVASVNSRSADTRVLVRNGDTAVIGGIYQSDETVAEEGVPFFKDIPVLGYLFKKKSRNKSKNELLIFLTPKVIDTAKGGASQEGVVQ